MAGRARRCMPAAASPPPAAWMPCASPNGPARRSVPRPREVQSQRRHFQSIFDSELAAWSEDTAPWPFADRGRKGRLSSRSLPPPPRACGSPAHGSPVGASPLDGLARPPSGERHGKLSESSEEDAGSSRPPSLGSPTCQHTIRTHRKFRPTPATCRSSASRPCLVRQADTRAGLLSCGTSFTHPPTCGPSLHGHYPASWPLWPL